MQLRASQGQRSTSEIAIDIRWVSCIGRGRGQDMLYSNKVEHHPLTRELRIGDREKEKRGRVRRGDWYRVARCYQECNYYDTLNFSPEQYLAQPKAQPQTQP